MISKSVAKTEMMLLTTKTASDRSMTFFRSNPENSRGRTGADRAMTSAKPLTSSAARVIETPNMVATSGNMPITPISVFRMPNTPTASISMSNPLFFFMISPVWKDSGIRWRGDRSSGFTAAFSAPAMFLFRVPAWSPRQCRSWPADISGPAIINNRCFLSVHVLPFKYFFTEVCRHVKRD